MPEWQHPTTAPKDGTRILIAYAVDPQSRRDWAASNEYFIRIARWHVDRWKLDMAGNFRTQREVVAWHPLPSILGLAQFEIERRLCTLQTTRNGVASESRS
jgi:hypothetical protein